LKLDSPSGARLPLVEIPVEEARISVDGVGWRYQKAGAGPTLLLVHGLLGYSFSWRFALPMLARHATVYAMDLPGAGFSDRPRQADCTMRGIAARLIRFLDVAGISQCDLLGTSHGGAIAMTAVALAPQRFRRLILVAPVNPWSARGKSLSVLLSNPMVAPLFVRIAPHLPVVQAHYLKRLYGDLSRMRPGTMEGYRQPLLVPGAFEYCLSILRSWNRDLKELGAVIPSLASLPNLLMWGDRDAAVDPRSADRLKEQIRGSELVMFPGVGHLPYEEVPQEFSRAVMDFLQVPR